MTKIVGVKQLAEHLGISTDTALRWARRGLIPRLRATQRPVLFDLEAVEAMLRERGQVAQPEAQPVAG